ncbi:MAG TPA: biopolymer transporter ExbD [Steroidobacteraceae bacterium]|jgi:biopolymer transport protein ExbD|nr:biopolymer transporter ExbD [Steroidobacteraceae bacterium]HSY45892.1 biopolymer transporter ExbD [Steroidobacteraceae bacterium]
MRSWPTRTRKSARIEIIPMIDVMMFLLVFFVLISLNALPALGLRVVLPTAANPTHLDIVKRVTLTLTADGEIYIDGDKTSLDGVTERLRAMAQDSKLTVVISGDRDARLQPLVNLLDALKRAGIVAATVIARRE